jgi:hypothetical protein
MNRRILFPILFVLVILALFVMLANPGQPGREPAQRSDPGAATRRPVTASSAVPPAATGSAQAGDSLNGVPIEAILQLSPAVLTKMQSIYLRGQALGNNPRAFSKVGDSTIENPHFLARFDEKPYNLGPYANLQGVIDTFRGSFSRQGLAVQRGLHSWSVFDPMWADPIYCEPDESVIACEFRVHRPSIVLIRLGSNDVGVPESFEKNLRKLVEYSLEKGVIPVLGTKADRIEGEGNINNEIIRRVAADYEVPLWDFDLAAQALPDKGLREDGVHLSYFYEHDYTLPNALLTGHGLHNLTALMMLDRLWREVMGGGEQ